MNVITICGGEYISSLRALGHRAFCFHPDLCLEDSGRGRRDYSLRSAIELAGFEPDLVVVELFGPRPFLRGIESCPCPLVAYAYDSSFNHFWLSDYLRLFDCVFVDFKNSIPRLAAQGIEAHWWPYAISPEEFPQYDLPKLRDVGFVGVLEKRPRRQALIETLEKHFDVGVAGGLDAAVKDNPRLSLLETGRFYAQSRIVINECLYDGINFRVFEGMAAGSLLLTEASENGLFDLFTEGIHLASYTPETLEEKVRYYLEHEDERERIAAAGREQVLREHTRRKRLETLFERIEPILGRHPERDVPSRLRSSGEAIAAFCRRWPHWIPAEHPHALENLDAALRSNPRDGLGYRARGRLRALNGELSGAVSDLNEAAARQPDDFMDLFHLGHLLIACEHTQTAIRCFQNGLERFPEIADEQREQARFLLEKGELGPALWIALGHLLEAIGLDLEANSTPLHVLTRDTPPLLLPLWANEYFILARLEGADASCMNALGRCYERMNHAVEAHECFMIAFTEDPENTDTIFRAGANALGVFQRDEGLKLLRFAVLKQPERREAVEQLRLRRDEREMLLAD